MAAKGKVATQLILLLAANIFTSQQKCKNKVFLNLKNSKDLTFMPGQDHLELGDFRKKQEDWSSLKQGSWKIVNLIVPHMHGIS